MSPGIRICIDRGGTFTDCIAFVPTKNGFEQIVVKLLSVDDAYKDAPTEAIRRILEKTTGKSIPRTDLLDTTSIELIRMGTTVATNALLERKGERTALLITKGFKDLLYIGNQSRENIFDIKVSKQNVLYETVIEVEERVVMGTEKDIKSLTGEYIKILKAPDLKKVRDDLEALKKIGIKNVAICFMHAYCFVDHELQVEKLCKEMGFDVCLSSKTSPMTKIVPRGVCTTANAYLTPSITQYLDSFYKGFDKNIKNIKVEFMQSDGGLVTANKFMGFKSILSGPAGGVVGYATTSYQLDKPRAVIGFDMGGTSTDVSRFGGKFEHVFETITAGITIQAPQLDINTVAAGGGSILAYRNGMFVVGPESAGANPGPCCYRKGGPLTITDANLVLGRLDIETFPKIFGKNEDLPLDIEGSRTKFVELAKNYNIKKSIDEIALGFVTVANEAMCRPIRALTQGKGYNTSDHVLSCFGGAGGQHAFAIAKALGIETVLIHRYASILSAYGQALADVVEEVQMPCKMKYKADNKTMISKLNNLVTKATKKLQDQGFPEDHIDVEIYLNLRYEGTATAIMTLKPKNDWDFMKVFVENYRNEFGFTLNRPLLVDDLRVRGIGKSIATGADVKWTKVFSEVEELSRKRIGPKSASKQLSIYWDIVGRVETPCYQLGQLKPGDEIVGPALLIDKTSTIAVEPKCTALITSEHIVGTIEKYQDLVVDGEIRKDEILLSVFGHRFMSIAEQMGRTLQKTSISTNIKERLDFSCALFDQSGGLVANAPHIPVHLGSMQEAVKWQVKFHGSNLKAGDVLLSNHPSAGGSHLPDITVITPVFEEGKVVFFVASRGHHADIGGKRAGSMPPDSRELFEEGAAVKSFFLVREGKFDEIGITNILVTEPAQYEGCSGTRCLKDNISDLKAQVAANNRGIALVKDLILEYGLATVQAYMRFIQETASETVSKMLLEKAKILGPVFGASDKMDDGSTIKLKISVDENNGTANFDFTGTDREVYGNTNAPLSVTYSAIIYCLRCLVQTDIPLNQGALAPVNIIVPPGTLLNPIEGAAVVGGNVLTSQRLCDVIFKAFEACSASQGCCNNLTFGKDAKDGKEGFGYYETIAGGSGSGPSWHGTSGTHSHMTNTRITDPEILEQRYPVILRQFSLRPNSGGAGEFYGGDGIIREIEFLEELQVSILSERRVFSPYGLKGGEDGKVGVNTIIRDNGKREINFGGKNHTIVKAGDRIRIETPGAGGFGKPTKTGEKRKASSPAKKYVKKAGGSIQNYLNAQNSV